MLATPTVWGLTFRDRSYWVDFERYRQTKAAIWTLLFPTIEEDPWLRLGANTSGEIVLTPEMKTWRNAWCDVHNSMTHFDHHRNVFVTTNTRDFQRTAARLLEGGVKNIATPAKAIALVRLSANLH